MRSRILKAIARKSERREGQALIVAIIFLIALTFLGLGLIMLSSIDIHSSRNLRLSEKALSAAEEGVMVGMAYAASPTSGFSSLNEGQTMTINSLTHNSDSDQYQYLVTLIMGGEAMVPKGEEIGVTAEGVKASFRTVVIRSEGYVLESPGATFDPSNPPHVQRDLEIIARVRMTKS
ncbi:MAG: hypothetical protein R6V10_17210 [bacterium]